MKSFIPILIILYTLVVGFTIDDGGTEGMEPTTGYIDITVESNVNRLFFKYAMDEVCLSLTGSTLQNINGDSAPAMITVPVREFKCTNKMAYNDFLTLLKEGQYPEMTITIPQKVIPRIYSTDSVVLNDVLISIAGVSKKYDIECKIENLNTDDQFLIGTAKIRLSDLEIEPPVKSFGLVKVRDEIIVKFGFCLN